MTDRALGLFLTDYFHPVPPKRKWYRKPELKEVEMEKPEQLKPCPWCGKIPVMTLIQPSVYALECENVIDCPVFPWMHRTYKTTAEAIAAWNKRAGDDGD